MFIYICIYHIWFWQVFPGNVYEYGTYELCSVRIFERKNKGIGEPGSEEPAPRVQTHAQTLIVCSYLPEPLGLRNRGRDVMANLSSTGNLVLRNQLPRGIFVSRISLMCASGLPDIASPISPTSRLQSPRHSPVDPCACARSSPGCLVLRNQEDLTHAWVELHIASALTTGSARTCMSYASGGHCRLVIDS